jgi:cold shock CspA family protein
MGLYLSACKRNRLEILGDLHKELLTAMRDEIVKCVSGEMEGTEKAGDMAAHRFLDTLFWFIRLLLFPESKEGRRTGRVKYYVPQDGCGLIVDQKLGDLFFHHGELLGVEEVQAGQMLEYDVLTMGKEPMACNVTVVSSPAR